MTREEAIKEIKMWGIEAPRQRAVLETLIPELRESEDERTRKSLIKFLTTIKEISESGRTSWAVREEDAEMCKSFLDYLEKQKEEEGYDFIPVKSTLEYKLGFADGRDYEKQKEPKPALTPKRIFPKFAIGDTVCRPMWSDHTIREIYVDNYEPTYICVNEEGVESHIPFSEQNKWTKKEETPAEWSGEGAAKKYIDVDKLKAEIERRRLQNRYIDTDGYEQELFEIIDSLQQAQASANPGRAG